MERRATLEIVLCCGLLVVPVQIEEIFISPAAWDASYS